MQEPIQAASLNWFIEAKADISSRHYYNIILIKVVSLASVLAFMGRPDRS
jgi:hypothetical protein